jgi:hypothetical protein
LLCFVQCLFDFDLDLEFAFDLLFPYVFLK